LGAGEHTNHGGKKCTKMIFKFYLRFCASINYFFERKMGYDDPGIFALLFIVVVQQVYSYGIFYVIEILVEKKIDYPSYFPYVLLFLWAVLDYFFAFRKEQLYRHYKTKMNPWLTIAIIVFGYILMLAMGYYCRELFA